jgi:hypothetical protein
MFPQKPSVALRFDLGPRFGIIGVGDLFFSHSLGDIRLGHLHNLF